MCFPPRMVRVIEELASDWRWLDERIEGLSGDLEELARRDAGCERLMSVPGIGPIISSAMVAAIVLQGSRLRRLVGTRAQAGLDRRPHHKRGNRYLRVQFVQAAWVVLVKVKPNRQLHCTRLCHPQPARPRDAPDRCPLTFTFCGWQRPLLRPCNRR